jgi:transcriptional regulator with XRE-family HTH domain
MSQSIRRIFARNVKKYRQKSKLKREELSLALGFDNSYISKLEKEKINITIDKMELIAEYFKVPVKNFFE